MATTPVHLASVKRKADEITTDEVEEVVDVQDEPNPKKPKIDLTGIKGWNIGMELPQGKPRPKFIGESEEDRVSGSGTVEDPKILWLGKAPLDAENKKANEDVVRRAASSIKTITHIYIRSATKTIKFVDRDGKRICIWNPDVINFGHKTAAADPYISLAFGTNADNLVLYGFINVAVDDNGKPTDFATSRNPDHVVDEDDRIFELFPYEEDQQYCAPYCNADHKVLIDACEFKLAMITSTPVLMKSQDLSTTIVHVYGREGRRGGGIIITQSLTGVGT
ncbi:hypothetical protein F5Y05DRAFT_412196 [Hypoxylon sp. FL0543]|nr:hypothetical protein F5Y05DRAFT_412196 [Hypoxylon sp. FL0543]